MSLGEKSSLAVSLGMSLSKKTHHPIPVQPPPPPPPPKEEHESEQDFEQEEDELHPPPPAAYGEDPSDPIEEFKDEEGEEGEGDQPAAEEEAEEEAHPDQDAEDEDKEKKKKRKTASQKPAAKKAKKINEGFDLKKAPRKGIALVPAKGTTANIKVLKVLYAPPNPTVFPWKKVAEKSFVPSWNDVFRVWVRYTQPDKSTSDQFILLVHTLSDDENLCYRWLSKETEMTLLAERNLHNGFTFSGRGKTGGVVENLTRINAYHNRLPGKKRLAREGFVSDHVAQEYSPDRYTAPDSFYQESELLFEELDFYMPTDILNAAEMAEKQALDGLAEEEEEGAEENDEGEPPAEKAPKQSSKKATATAVPATPKAKPKSRTKNIPASGTSASSYSFLCSRHSGPAAHSHPGNETPRAQRRATGGPRCARPIFS